MKKNVGNTDRIIRFLAGIVLLALGIFAVESTTWRVVLIVGGIVMFFTGFSSLCMLYLPFGIKTNKGK